MATIKLGSTKRGSQLINYAEKRAEEKEGVNCSSAYAKAQMKATRKLWGKRDGIQAHHVIQSFKPNEVTAEQANQIGRDLVAKVAPEHEAVVYTHTDKEHIHNHIVMNAVNFETGKKYQSSKKDLYRIRKISDALCKAHDLSIVEEKTAAIRYTLAEQELLEKGKTSWKDEIRQAIDITKNNVIDFDSFKKHLERDYGIETKVRGKTLSFKHPELQRFVRANKLGADYEKEVLERGFERQIGTGQEFERTIERDPGTKQDHDKLYPRADERGNSQGFNDQQPVGTNQEQQRQYFEQHAGDIGKAKRTAREKQKRLAAGFDQWTQANEKEQQRNDQQIKRTGNEQSETIDHHKRGNESEHEKNREQYEKYRRQYKERDGGLSL